MMQRLSPALVGWSAAGLVALLAPLVVSERQLFLLMSVMTLAVFATSFNVLLGYTGLVSFAHASYYGVGAYTVGLGALHLGMPPVLGFVLSPIVAGLVAYLTGLVALRATRLYFALLTLALGQLLFLAAFQWRSVTRGDDGIHGVVLPPGLAPTLNRYYFVLVGTVIALTILAVVLRSPFGQTLRAIRENRERTGFLGIKVKRYELASFTIGGAFAGYAGGMFAVFERSAFPELMHWTTSAQPIFVTLIGGLSSFAGPTVGAVVYGLLQDYITRNIEYWQAVLGVVVLLIILFLPGGLVEGAKRVVALVTGRRPAGSSLDPAAGAVAADETEREPTSTGGG
jgi:branched-chain amino acid transport system permease protein